MRHRRARLKSDYPESVRFLYALGNEFKTLKLGLERIEALLASLGNPQSAMRIIHVAGTNGKGSTCAMIESALRVSGRRTGLYTSPHLVEPTERIRISGTSVSTDDFTAAFEAVHQAATKGIEAGDLDQHPTYFETTTAMAFWLFRQFGVEWAVLETGMGGRLDATNVVYPELAVVTPIDFDHERYLGDTIPEIAFEKAGILKHGRPAVFSRQRPEASEVLNARARELGNRVVYATDWETSEVTISAYGSRMKIRRGSHALELECPLIGAHQVDNALTAVTALVEAGLGREEIEEGVRLTLWPGRLERVQREPDLFLDGAHNPAGAAALAAYIRQFHAGRRVWMVFAAMRDKDVGQLGGLLFPLASELIFTSPVGQPRAFRGEEIRNLTGQSRAKVTATPAEALALLREAGPADVAFVTGSLYLVGEVRGLLLPA